MVAWVVVRVSMIIMCVLYMKENTSYTHLRYGQKPHTLGIKLGIESSSSIVIHIED